MTREEVLELLRDTLRDNDHTASADIVDGEIGLTMGDGTQWFVVVEEA